MSYAIFILLIATADQLSKLAAQRLLEYHSPVPFLGNLVNLNLTQNTGASFSLFAEHTALLTIFSLGFVIVILLFWHRLRKNNPPVLVNISLAMILGGAIGNIIDRIRLGYVIDFFEFTFVRFAIFNVADCFITVGAVIFMLLVIFDKKLEI